MRTTFALYQPYDSAKKAVDHLVEKNFPKEEINLIIQRSAIENAWQVNGRTIYVDVADKVGSEYMNKKVDGIDEMIGKQRPIPTPFAGEVYAAGQVARVMARFAADPALRARKLKKGSFQPQNCSGAHQA